MGQLPKASTPLDLEATRQQADQLRDSAVTQFVQNYNRSKGIQLPVGSLRWGYEIEHFLLTDRLTPLLESESVLDRLSSQSGDNNCWNPEYASFMIESIPPDPFVLEGTEGRQVESTMQEQQDTLDTLLSSAFEGAQSLTIGSLPCLGAERAEERCPSSHSLYFPSQWIAKHPRFSTLTRNIRERRGHLPVNIQVPIWQDQRTKLDVLKMDAMGFGMGCCCLQTTTEFPSLEIASLVYDQLAVIAPIALTLTASSPAFRGWLIDQDCRWSVLEQSVDDRTQEELKNPHIKSRYSPSPVYLSDRNATLNEDIPVHLETLKRLLGAGVPRGLARHFSHLFWREPLIAYEGADYSQINPEASNWVDGLQSTCWHSIRLKLPMEDAGWRIEFRPMEVQPTPFENVAFSLFVQGFVMALLLAEEQKEHVSFTIPMPLVHDNFRTAIQRDAVLSGKFYWKSAGSSWFNCCCAPKEHQLKSVDHIVNDELLPFIRKWAPDFYRTNSSYFEFVGERASGVRPTVARRLREIICTHPLYEQDSKVHKEMMQSIVDQMKPKSHW